MSGLLSEMARAMRPRCRWRTAKNGCPTTLFACCSGLVGLLVVGARILFRNRMRFGNGILRDDRLLRGIAAGRSPPVGRCIEHALIAWPAGCDAFVAAESFAGERLKLLQAGQLFEIAEAEAHQKFF